MTGNLLPALRRAAVQATTAASFYNTQPWRIELTGQRLRLSADRTRQLTAHDPSGRQLMISCGCALLNARVALAGEAVETTVARFPAGVAPGAPLADVWADPPGSEPIAGDVLARLAKVIEARHTNRRPFQSAALPDGLPDRLQAAAAAEGADLDLLRSPAQQTSVRSLQVEATRFAEQDRALAAEHRAWARTAGYADGNGYTESSGVGLQDGTPAVEPNLLLLSTPGDSPMDWLRAGEALQRILLVITDEGCAVSLDSLVTQLPEPRDRLRTELELPGHPQVLLQVGAAPAGPQTRRRRLMDVIIERLDDSR